MVTNTLIVKHLPACLTNTEKVKMLQYFGAVEVRVMPCHGRMKHCAFATFPNSEEAKKAISRLHQVEIHDSVLSVEFAKKRCCDTTNSNISKDESQENLDKVKRPMNSNIENHGEKNIKQKSTNFIPIAAHLGINYPSNPGIKYVYPPPNGDILLNICSALITVPKLYTQLLHLMNKMHLMPPFSPTNIVPGMIKERVKEICQLSPTFHENSVRPADLPRDPDKLELVEMSESESEYESSGSEGADKLKSLDMDVPERVMNSRKRKMKNSDDRIKKRRMLAKPVAKPTHIVPEAKTIITKVADAFDELEMTLGHKQIEIKVTTTKPNEGDPSNIECSSDGFGKLQPLPAADDQVQIYDENQNIEKVLKDFITRKQLSSCRMSEKEMKHSPVFENYKKGDTTCRLYVKNLSKRVTEKDLEFIYGSFVNYDDENERNMFDIQLLKQGRMKGQAFVGFRSVEAASTALKETNGYLLMNKPMVVTFARSKKPK